MKFENWGLIEYQEALNKQMALVESVETHETEETIVFCTHTPVVTTGRGTKAGDVFGWQGSTIEVSRGGRATYHGPSQLVVYPILDLRLEHAGFRSRDLNSYLRFLENVILKSLASVGVESEVRTVKTEDGLSQTGVWVGSYKIASIGVAVRKWISYHGISINLDKDASAFGGINPCGFSSKVMKSVEDILGKKINRDQLKKYLELHFLEGAQALPPVTVKNIS